MGGNIILAGEQLPKKTSEQLPKILEKYAKDWDVDIVFVLSHGNNSTIPPEMDFDKLYLFCQLLPEGTVGVERTTISGYKIDGKTVEFIVDKTKPQPCPQGDSLKYTTLPARSELIRDEDGNTMAVVWNGAIYVLNDFVHSRNAADYDISLKIMHYIMKNAAERTTIISQLKSGVEEKSKRVLESVLKTQFTQRLDKELLQLKAAKDTIAQYEKGITDGVRKIMATEKIVDAVRMNIDNIPGALDKVWKEVDKMSKGPSYTSVAFSKTGIKAITSPITIKYSGEEYEMGRYEVKLAFNGECTILALDTKIDGSYDHPHVSNGRVCWGNFSGYIPKLIGSSEFDVALVQIHTFLCHYDSGNPYKKLEFWPKKSDKKKKATKVEEGMQVI